MTVKRKTLVKEMANDTEKDYTTSEVIIVSTE